VKSFNLFVTCSIILICLSIITIYSGCSEEKELTIAEIQNNVEKYTDETVKIEGKVTEIFEAQSIENNIYRISDDYGNLLWVKPATNDMPKVGEEVEVTGSIITAASIEGKTYGIVLIEKSEKEQES